MDVKGEVSRRPQDAQVGLEEKAELETDPGLGPGASVRASRTFEVEEEESGEGRRMREVVLEDQVGQEEGR